jgi:hypothetical protein
MAEGGEEEGDDDSPEQKQATGERESTRRDSRDSRLDSLFCYYSNYRPAGLLLIISSDSLLSFFENWTSRLPTVTCQLPVDLHSSAPLDGGGERNEKAN